MRDIYYVNVGCANVYSEPSYRSEIETQTLLWESVKVEAEQEDFLRIYTEDEYAGWISRSQIVPSTSTSNQYKIVTQSLSAIYSEPSVKSELIREVTALGRLLVDEVKSGWVRVILPDGEEGWIQEHAFTPLPQLTRQNLIDFARGFLGVSYLWGGKTPKGFDCSGLVQFLFAMFKIPLKRNASMQFEKGKFVSENPEDGQMGDLMFFEENGKITHVGICLGNSRLLHARGFVRVNSLITHHPDFSERLKNEFVAIRTYF